MLWLLKLGCFSQYPLFAESLAGRKSHKRLGNIAASTASKLRHRRPPSPTAQTQTDSAAPPAKAARRCSTASSPTDSAEDSRVCHESECGSAVHTRRRRVDERRRVENEQ
jgi:hypothetical protein